jgi:hypothetical protein
VDNGKLNSYNKILSSRDRVPWTRRAHWQELHPYA